MIKKVISVLTIVSLCLLLVMLNYTTPATAGPFGILVIFVFIYLSSLGVMTFFISSISRIISHLSRTVITKKPIKVLSFRQSYYYSSILSAAPIMLIALQSVGAIGIYEFILIIIFEIIGFIYVSKKN